MAKLNKQLPFNLTKIQIIGLVVAILTLVLTFLLVVNPNPTANNWNLFYFICGISFVIAGMPFFISLIVEGKIIVQKEEMFLEFARGLVESVKAGTPISKSIFNIKGKNYGPLNPYIEKLANQIALGIPIKTSMETFARDIGSPTITRSISIIGEAEKAGGKIDDILESVVKSVSQVEKLRKERKSAMYTLVVQGYIIFLIFVAIMLVMQFKVLPIAAQMGASMGDMGSGGGGLGGALGGFLGGPKATAEQMARPFLWLLIVQGFFAGLVIGKLSEGNMKAGLRHSFILLVIALLVETGANLFIGTPGSTPTNSTSP